MPSSNYQPIRLLDQGISGTNSHTEWQTVQIQIINFFKSQLIWIYTICKDRAYPVKQDHVYTIGVSIGNSEFQLNLIYINPCPAEPRYVLSLQTVQIQISWLLKKPTDLDLHCLPLSMDL